MFTKGRQFTMCTALPGNFKLLYQLLGQTDYKRNCNTLFVKWMKSDRKRRKFMDVAVPVIQILQKISYAPEEHCKHRLFHEVEYVEVGCQCQ